MLRSVLATAAAAAAIAAPLAARADVHTFPVKSANLDAALGVQFYTINAPNIVSAADLHAVHGCQTPDGGYVMCGKGLESEESTATESFCIKYNGAGATVWGWRSGWSGSDAANAVVPVSSTEVAVVGWKTEGLVGKRYITKLNSNTGTAVWTTTDFSASDKTSFFEMIVVDGDDVWLSGGINKVGTEEMSFKSYGNVAGGEATVEKMPKSALTSASAPTASDVTWTSTLFTGYMTAKVARPVGTTAGSNVAVLLFGEESNKHASLALINPANGAIIWGPTNYDAHGEGTDMQVAEDGLSVVIAGQGGPTGELNGRLTKVAISNSMGSHVWTKDYSSCGTGTSSLCNKKLILNECWGVTKLADGGFALACGTGIEGCGTEAGLSGQDQTDCNAGEGDKRPGAYKRGGGVWQSMVVRTNSLGEQQWLRVDSYKAPDGPALGANGWVARSSAAEWAVTTADGGIAIITDQVTGTGLIKMGGNNTAGGGTACTGTNCGNSGGGGGSGGNTGGSSGGDGKGDDSSGSLAAVHHWSAAGVAAVIASLAALL